MTTPDHITDARTWAVRLEICSLTEDGVPDGLHLDELKTISYEKISDIIYEFVGSWWDLNWLAIWYHDGDVAAAYDALQHEARLLFTGLPTKEYGIVLRRDDSELHRGPMTLEAAIEWMNTWITDGGRADAFYIVERKVGGWHAY